MDNDFKITLAAARVNAGMTQEEVAEIMQISKTTIVNIEKGKVDIKPAVLSYLSKLYKIPEDNIFLQSKST